MAYMGKVRVQSGRLGDKRTPQLNPSAPLGARGDVEPMSPSETLSLLLEEKVEFLLLQFTDILGSIKTVEIPANKFEVALGGEVAFDGSALEGFHRTIESELLLKPDLDTLRIAPPVAGETRTARLICDVHNLDHTPFEGCPRTRLKQVLSLFREK